MLVVLGGDVTIRTAAEACTGTNTYLLPLPGGTLNMLPRALYGDTSWQDTLKIHSLLPDRERSTKENCSDTLCISSEKATNPTKRPPALHRQTT